MLANDRLFQQEILEFLDPRWTTPTIESRETAISGILDHNQSTKERFKYNISIPVDNRGTIHIKPTGKITIYDMDGTQLTRIGKEIIRNTNGVYMGERIVDHLPINTEDGNVLPNTSRTFTVNWQGFAYEYTNLDGTRAIEYESPSEYYTRISNTSI